MQVLIFVLLIINLIWGYALHLEPTHTTFFNYFYNFAYGLSYFLSSIYCFKYSLNFPKFRGPLILMGIAFVLFFFAQLIWLYYNLIIKSEVPYPGIADLFWVCFYPLIATSFISLIQKLNTQLKFSNLVEVIVLSGVSFFLISSFLNLNSTQINLDLTTQFLNFFYPVADSLLIGLGISTLRSEGGNINIHLLYFVFGFIILAAGDTIFAYQTAYGTYWNGNLADLSYAISGFLMLQGIYKLPQSFNQRALSNSLSTPISL